jgi:uncharacterized repeat protein (TIGR01451 family)
MKKILLLFTIIFFGNVITTYSQVTCGGTFTDAAGPNANYANNSNVTTTICPTNPGEVVTVTFTSFNTEANFDGLYVYNGNAVVPANQIASTNPAGNVPGGLAGAYWGTTIPGPFTSTAADGCLTFVFRSDGVVNNPGWIANVTCGLPPTCLAPTALVSSAITANAATLSWVNEGVATSWEVLALPCGSPAPNSNTTGWTTSSTNPFTFTGLTPATCYDFYVRGNCSSTSNGVSLWSGPRTITTLPAPPACGGIFTDSAGPTANYANNSNVTTTICPTNPGEVVTVTFTSFDTEATWDGLYVYNGNAVVPANQIASTNPAGNVPGGLAGAYWGTTIPGPFTSTAADGCLTFVFRSDGSANRPGWVANVTCGPLVDPNCLPPTSLLVSNITPTSAVIGWTATANETNWMLNIQMEGSPSTTIFVQNNPFVLTNLSCNSTYAFSVSAVCNEGTSLVSAPVIFMTSPCAPLPGQPISLTQCSDNGIACFDLTQNNIHILANLNPAEYTISYHETQTDASVGTNALISPYCSLTSPQVIYARLQNNTTQEFQIFPFEIMVVSVSNTITQLGNMEQCDVDGNGVITFDFTTNAAQINTTNSLTYYSSLVDAQNLTNPIAVPSSFIVNVQPNPILYYIRETVPNGCDIIYSFQVRAYPNCNIAYTCSGANSLCNSLGVPFQNTTNAGSTGQAGCLASTPNATWFYLPISNAGTINLQINQNSLSGTPLDVDYIVYGPFSSLTNACSQLSPNNIVSCSFSSAAVEFPIIPNAQPGQYYLMMVTNFSNQPGLITITELSNSVGAIDCSGLRLNAFLDSNSNGIKDVGEQNFPLGQFIYEVNDNGNVHNIISPNGIYNIYDTNATNSYDLSYAIDPNYVASYGITTSSYSNVNVVIGAGMQTYNFPITVTQSYNDLAVNIIPLNAPRPGFTYQERIVYTNYGNQTIASGTVTFSNDALVTITANSQAGTTATANGFTYNFTNLLPFETRTITVTMQIPNIPTVTLGNLLTSTASIAPITGDVVPANNTSTCSQIIIGSYDPNDKMESHGERILHSTFTANDYLNYTIRFENTGTASAINVRINDVLDSRLDENTIRMISASHNYIMDRVDNNLTWRFDNIQLPVSVADTNIGKGYITFQIKPRAGYAVGDIIPNTASIYFDFNPPIITNTFNTEFVAQLGINDFENSDFVFYPNPVADRVTISVKNNGSVASIAVYDVLGKLIVSEKPTSAASTQTIDLSSVSKGVYLLEVTSDNNLKVVKKFVKK